MSFRLAKTPAVAGPSGRDRVEGNAKPEVREGKIKKDREQLGNCFLLRENIRPQELIRGEPEREGKRVRSQDGGQERDETWQV